MDSLHKKNVSLDALMPLIREELAAGNQVSFSPRGVSMRPLLRQGMDTVTLAALPDKLKKYDLPLYQRDDGQYVLHRIVRTGETYTCIGDNQFKTEPGLRHDQMIAIAVGFTRDGNYIPVSSLGYRLYCRVWHYSRPVRHVWRVVRNLFRRILK